MPHLQQTVHNWDDEKDPNGTKTYTQMRKYFIQKDLNNHSNITALGKTGIANVAVNIQVKDKYIDDSQCTQRTAYCTFT